MSIQDSTTKLIEHSDEILELPLRLTKTCMLSVRDDNAFVSPVGLEAILHALALIADDRSAMELDQLLETSSINKNTGQVSMLENLPFYFHNFVLISNNHIKSLRPGLNEEAMSRFNTEFEMHTLMEADERQMIFNHVLKRFADLSPVPIVLSQKTLAQASKIIAEPMTLVTCSSLIFRPFNTKYWEQLWSLKFRSNIHLAIETEFYFTKGFFHVGFHETFHKIEIPGQIYNGLQMKMTILLPRCSSDLVHLYANIKEYLHLPFSSAFIGVCIPKISLDIDIDLIQSLNDRSIFSTLISKDKANLSNLGELNDANNPVFLAGARSLGHFAVDMSVAKTDKSSCYHSIDLSPVTPWVFFANRPFLFLITLGDYYLLMGQMLGPKLRRDQTKLFSKQPSKLTKTNVKSRLTPADSISTSSTSRITNTISTISTNTDDTKQTQIHASN